MSLRIGKSGQNLKTHCDMDLGGRTSSIFQNTPRLAKDSLDVRITLSKEGFPCNVRSSKLVHSMLTCTLRTVILPQQFELQLGKSGGANTSYRHLKTSCTIFVLTAISL